jgi:hypothetical protein
MQIFSPLVVAAIVCWGCHIETRSTANVYIDIDKKKKKN